MPIRRVVVHVDCAACGTPLPLPGVVTAVVCDACGWDGAIDRDNWRWVLGADERTITAGERILGETTDEPPACATCDAPFAEAAIAAAIAGAKPAVACDACHAELALRAFDGDGSFSTIIGEGVRAVDGTPVNIPCTNCGARLVVDGKTAKPSCSFCQTRNTIRPELWRQLHPLVRPFHLYAKYAPRALAEPEPPQPPRSFGGIAITLGIIAAIVTVVIVIGRAAIHSNGPTGWGSAGGPCTGEAACSYDKRYQLKCVDDRFVASLACKGPLGCRLTNDGETSSCDYTYADPDDPCNIDDLSCSTDHLYELKCDGTKFVKLGACKGPAGCVVTRGAKEGTLECDDHVGEVGDLCLAPGRTACTTDGTSTLVCTAGKLAFASHCLGPTGCKVIPHPQQSTTTIACDHDIAEVGDPCDAADTACNTDRTSLLRCRGGRLAVAEHCKPCTVEDLHVLCK